MKNLKVTSKTVFEWKQMILFMAHFIFRNSIKTKMPAIQDRSTLVPWLFGYFLIASSFYEHLIFCLGI